MTRRLVLVRHGKAESGSPDGRDHSRLLAARGADQAADTARWVASPSPAGAGLPEPDLVLVSSAARTAATWDAMAPHLHPATVRSEPALYDTSAPALVALLAEVPDAVTSVLVVGHEPVLSGAASALAGPGSDPVLVVRVDAGMATGSAAVLEVDGPWGSLALGSARLVGLHRPR